MPTWEIEINGEPHEVEAPDQETATKAARAYAARVAPAAQAAPPSSPPTDQPLAGGPVIPILTDLGTGAAKGALKTVLGLGKMVRQLGVGRSNYRLSELTPEEQIAFSPTQNPIADTTPKNTTEGIGQGLEQTGEFLAIPGPGKVTGAMKAAGLVGQGLAAAGLTAAHGGSSGEAMAAGVTGGLPIADVMRAGGAMIGEQAAPLVRAALKPTVAALKRISGGAGQGLDAKAAGLINFILENRVTTPQQARDIVFQAEGELSRVLSVKNAPTDAPTRALRYLKALENSAAKQGLPASDVATIRGAAAEMLGGVMGEDVMQLGPNGWETIRAPRTDMSAREALDSARASSRWQTRKAWGEQKGATMEATKAVERAQRDAVKVAVPETVPLLARERMGLQAAEILDRAAQRSANRDAVSLPAHVIAAGELASGRPPVLAIAANWLRNNQLRAGIYADRLAKAVERGNAAEVAFYLQKLGVGTGATAAMASE